MSVYYHSAAELDNLPNHAVIYDHNNQVWQKLVERDNGIPYIGFGFVWFQPGDVNGYLSKGVALPARLLDDGL